MLKLTSQQFARMLDGLRRRGPASGHEKRQFTRIDVQARLTLASLLDGKIVRLFTALTRDVSLTGMGLMQHEHFAQGELFLANFPCEKEPINMVCRAMFCRPLADGICTIGVQFENLAPPELIERFSDAVSALATSPGSHAASPGTPAAKPA